MSTKTFWIDVIIATVFIFLFMWFAVNTFNKLQFLDPIGDAIGDTEITDIVFSQMREEPDADEKVVLVNIGLLNREGIAAQLRVLNKYNPKVIGIDALFSEPRDPYGDSVFAKALSEVKNLVLPHKLFLVDSVSGKFDPKIAPLPEFAHDSKPNFVNLITPAGDQEQFKSVRSFTPQEETTKGESLAFGVRLAEYYDSTLSQKFLDRGNDYEIINFKRNTVDFHKAGQYSGKYWTLDAMQVIEDDFAADIVENKVIIMGYLGADLQDTSWDDKFFTPLNVHYAGKTNPDMYGAVVHANIVSMILNEDYIGQMHKYTGIILGIFLCLLNVALFSLIYHRMAAWYDGLTKLIQIAELAILFGLIIWVFNQFEYKMDLTVGLVAIALAGDALEIYYGVVRNTFMKIKMKLMNKQ